MANGEANGGWDSDRGQSIRSRLPRRQVPKGWSVGNFANYADAQAAVDSLNDCDEFPVSDLAIISIDLTQVEHVVDRLTWPKILGGGTLYELWVGLFFGLILGFFQENWVGPLIVGLGAGAIFGVVLTVVPYTMQSSKQGLSTTTETVVRRYDVLCNPRNAERTRDLLAQRALGGNRG